jgi:hypothetical protein
MSTQPANRLLNYPGEDRRRFPANFGQERSAGFPWGLVLTGAAVVGLGLLAWQFLGPDVKRYLKIRNM